MKKILFLHGFFATGSCPMARALKEAFEGTAVVLTPDLPLHPKEALKEIRSIIDREQPDLLLGNSCGSFLATPWQAPTSWKCSWVLAPPVCDILRSYDLVHWEFIAHALNIVADKLLP